ncbi:MAG: 50S ribosomal protein L9 [Halofilum sp. (in: g-proteobacteria)]
MQVILVENVDNLGRLGDVVQVKSGYARNWLLPQGIARMATADNVKEIEARRAELERAEKEKQEVATRRQQELDGRTVTIRAKVGTEGKLFGSVSAGDIADALTADGAEVEKREVRMPIGPLREIGEYEIGIHLYSDVDVTVTVVVEPEA